MAMHDFLVSPFENFDLLINRSVISASFFLEKTFLEAETMFLYGERTLQMLNGSQFYCELFNCKVPTSQLSIVIENYDSKSGVSLVLPSASTIISINLSTLKPLPWVLRPLEDKGLTALHFLDNRIQLLISLERMIPQFRKWSSHKQLDRIM